MSELLCAALSCDRPAKKRGFCNTHYQRWRKHGTDGLDEPIRVQVASICGISGCEKRVHAHGFCSVHNHRFMRHGDPLAGGSRHLVGLSEEDRFWSYVNKNGPVLREELGPCWPWIGSCNESGYGQFMTSTGRPTLAHRKAYELTGGRIPGGYDLCHECDNPPCVRPSHTYPGTPLANNRDMMRKGRGDPWGHKKRKP